MNLPTIVMIDSSPEAAEMVRFVLWRSNLRCNLLVYPDAPTAQRCLLQQRRRSSDGPAPSLILLESDLDYTDGLDLLREMRCDPVLASAPVVVFPSCDMEGASAAMAAGATDFVPKPVDAELFSRCIQQLYMRWCHMPLNDRSVSQRPRMPMPPYPARRRSDWKPSAPQ